jgi:hypothetical protein
MLATISFISGNLKESSLRGAMIERERVLRALQKSWSRETSTKWSVANPALGQYSVTALVVLDRFGGHLLKTRVGEAWHFYNEIDDEVCDFTAEQFEAGVRYEHSPATREEALADTSLTQLLRLAQAFDAKWGED